MIPLHKTIKLLQVPAALKSLIFSFVTILENSEQYDFRVNRIISPRIRLGDNPISAEGSEASAIRLRLAKPATQNKTTTAGAFGQRDLLDLDASLFTKNVMISTIS
jgi:hypothetical protein